MHHRVIIPKRKRARIEEEREEAQSRTSSTPVTFVGGSRTSQDVARRHYGESKDSPLSLSSPAPSLLPPAVSSRSLQTCLPFRTNLLVSSAI